ncbi:hypothetical protein FSP39_020461 [Pinctada imbricata]|uniref:NACHT domain-containing protein n=1 Tax=Pinctada imbricata TaxID=66713 RepID=A0AA89C3X7_PINIB|nr:hypothetical protein FSP39_020461 [Pinctada imbricata]
MVKTIQQTHTEQQILKTNQVTIDSSLQQIKADQHKLEAKQETLNETMNERYQLLDSRQKGLQQKYQSEQGSVNQSLRHLRTSQHDIQSQQGSIIENLENIHLRQHEFQRHQDDFDQALQGWQTRHLQITKDQDTIVEALRSQNNELSSIDTNVQRHSKDIDDIRKHIKSGTQFHAEEQNVNLLKKKLYEINGRETLVIPVAPLQESDKIPIELLFASVIISEDPRYSNRKIKPSRREMKGTKPHGPNTKVVKSPKDMFTIDGSPVEHIYMLGDAAHGKTTYCMWLLKQWCNAQKHCTKDSKQNEWEKALFEFDFVFHLPLRNVDQSHVSFSEMICKDIMYFIPNLHKTVEHVLLSDSYRCFIIIDGLDEWNPNEHALGKLRCKALPNFDNMSNCVYFITMRPWRFDLVSRVVRNNDAVLEIQGLDEMGIRHVTRNVLVNYYKMNPWTDEYERKFLEIMRKLEDETLRSFFQIPLLAVVCIQIWYDGQQIGESMTSFYTAMVNMMIERANLKHDAQRLVCQSIDLCVPSSLSAYGNIEKYIHVISKLGEVAYDGLQTDQEKLEFQKAKLEKEVGEQELKFSLNVGFISQNEAPSVFTRNVFLHFFHKSIQEYLAAINIVTKKTGSDSFLKLLTSVSAIMKLSNVIKFVFGLNPSLVSDISWHILEATESYVSSYRKSPDFDQGTEELFKLHVSWYREIKYGKKVTGSEFTYYVPDVYLIPERRDKEAIQLCTELLSENRVVRSLFLRWVPSTGNVCVDNAVLNEYLAQDNSLVMICINGAYTNRIINTICGPSLETLHLSYIKIADSLTRPSLFLKNMPNLRSLKLVDVNFGDREVELSSDMVYLKRVEFWSVKMSTAGWKRFLHSLKDIQHGFLVIIHHADISADNWSIVRSSPLFEIREDVVWYRFKRVLPSVENDDESGGHSWL